MLGLGCRGAPQGGIGSRSVALGGSETMALQELEHTIPHPAGLELVGEHGCHGHRQAVRHVEHGQVGPGDSVEEPLLAEGVGAEALDVGHVGVEDDGEVAGAVVHLLQIATKSSALASSASPPSRRAKSEAEMAGMKRS